MTLLEERTELFEVVVGALAAYADGDEEACDEVLLNYMDQADEGTQNLARFINCLLLAINDLGAMVLGSPQDWRLHLRDYMPGTTLGGEPISGA